MAGETESHDGRREQGGFREKMKTIATIVLVLANAVFVLIVLRMLLG